MSRDFTPHLQYMFDREYHNEIRNAVISFVAGDGTKTVLSPDEKLKEQYPEMAFLFERTEELQKKFSNSRAFDIVMAQAEQAVTEVEQEVDKAVTGTEINQMEYGYSSDFDKKDIAAVTKAWFFGGLDKDFYYHERNDERLFEALSAEIKKTEKIIGANAMDNELVKKAAEKLAVDLVYASPFDNEQLKADAVEQYLNENESIFAEGIEKIIDDGIKNKWLSETDLTEYTKTDAATPTIENLISIIQDSECYVVMEHQLDKLADLLYDESPEKYGNDDKEMD